MEMLGNLLGADCWETFVTVKCRSVVFSGVFEFVYEGLLEDKGIVKNVYPRPITFS